MKTIQDLLIEVCREAWDNLMNRMSPEEKQAWNEEITFDEYVDEVRVEVESLQELGRIVRN